MKRKVKQSIYLNIFKIVAVDFPKLFNPISPIPLSFNIRSQLHYHYAKRVSPECIHTFLSVWTNRIEYHKAILQHNYRFDLADTETKIEDVHKKHALNSVQYMLGPPE